MNRMKTILAALVFIVSVLIIGAGQRHIVFAATQQQPPAEEVTPDRWPKTAHVNGAEYTVYQPQLDTWDGYHFEGHVAISVLPSGAKNPVFGLVKFTAVTEVDRLSRVVNFDNIRLVEVNFPSAPDKTPLFRQGLESMLVGHHFAPSLDRMQAALAVAKAEKKAKGVPVRNEPPKFIFSQNASVLVQIAGEPVWREVKGTKLVRVLNTRALILGDKSGKIYIHLFDGFLGAPALTGPWTVVKKAPSVVKETAKQLAKKDIVDLMEGPRDEKTKKRPSLKNGAPQIIVATSPTELILTQGPPDWSQIEGTMLLYVKNTTGDVFKDLNDQYTYVLATGRWFKAPDFTGPWQYVDPKKLPLDFSRIPDSSPKENVKASIPGTPQAQEAVISNEIPQTARVDREKVHFTPVISGEPDLKPIPDTTMSYVFNSPTPIIMVSPEQWFAVQNGIWFTAPSLSGRWVVAVSVPAIIYSIPPSSPVYYATYVKIYNATPNYVVVGYTPGYMGTIITSNGMVVYGTGYNYVSYVGPTVWYGMPVTYGYAANPTWTPWTGWIIGFGMGWSMGAITTSGCCWCYAPAPYWGPMPYAPYAGYARGPYGGAVVWGPRGWAATTGNVYQKWGPTTVVSRSSAGYNAWTGTAWSSKVGTSYNSVTGRISAGQKAAVSNVYTGNYAYGKHGATYNPNTGRRISGGSATAGNAYSGKQGTAKWGRVKGPNQSTSAAKIGNDYYVGHDGNMYRNTGNGWQKYDNGSWNNAEKPTPPAGRKSAESRTATGTRQNTIDSLNAQRKARLEGDQRSASSSWGSRSWGDGFAGRGPSGGERSLGGARRSWGGGSFGGGGFRGGGLFRR